MFTQLQLAALSLLALPLLLPIPAVDAQSAGGQSSEARPGSQRDGQQTPRVPYDPEDVLVRVHDMWGRIVAIDGDGVTIEFVEIPGSRATLQRAEVPADKLYLYRQAKIDSGSAEAWLDLAAFAKEHDLYLRRIDALQAAVQLDPSHQAEIRTEIAALRETCASERLARARELREAGYLDAAIAHLEETIGEYAECGSTEQARAMLEDIRADITAERTRAEQRRESRSETREQSPILATVSELIGRADEAIEHGLNNLGDYATATNAFEQALGLLRLAWKGLAEMDDRNAELSAAVLEERNRLTGRVRQKLVQAHIQLGHVYIARGDLNSAYNHAGRAAALAPSSARVSDLLNAITAAGGG